MRVTTPSNAVHRTGETYDFELVANRLAEEALVVDHQDPRSHVRH